MVVIRNTRRYYENADMSNVKIWQNQIGCIIKVFKKIIEVLSKMVSNLEIEMRKEEQEKKETILITDSGDDKG